MPASHFPFLSFLNFNLHSCKLSLQNSLFKIWHPYEDPNTFYLGRLVWAPPRQKHALKAAPRLTSCLRRCSHEKLLSTSPFLHWRDRKSGGALTLKSTFMALWESDCAGTCVVAGLAALLWDALWCVCVSQYIAIAIQNTVIIFLIYWGKLFGT